MSHNNIHDHCGDISRLNERQFDELLEALRDNTKWVAALATDLNTGFALIAAALQGSVGDPAVQILTARLHASSEKLSTKLTLSASKYLSNWDEAISEAKERLKQIKRSIRTFESLRDQGMEFPQPKERRTSGSKVTLGQSR